LGGKIGEERDVPGVYNKCPVLKSGTLGGEKVVWGGSSGPKRKKIFRDYKKSQMSVSSTRVRRLIPPKSRKLGAISRTGAASE